MQERTKAGGIYTIVCHGPDGQEKWRMSERHNLVVNAALQDMNEVYFRGGTQKPDWFIGLYGAGASNTPSANDTAASHVGWTEVVPYSNATRVQATFAAATLADPSVVTNAAAPAIFNINALGTVGGAFLISDSTKGGAIGTLFSASDFAAPGDRNVDSGDTLSVTYTFSLDAA